MISKQFFIDIYILFLEINKYRVQGDSVGGAVTCVVRNCPIGLGSPVFDKLDAEIGKALLSLPACKVSLLFFKIKFYEFF